MPSRDVAPSDGWFLIDANSNSRPCCGEVATIDFVMLGIIEIIWFDILHAK